MSYARAAAAPTKADAAAATRRAQPTHTTRSDQSQLHYIQRKLAIGAVNDPLEREADTVADQVLRMGNPAAVAHTAKPLISRKCARCGSEQDTIRRKCSACEAEEEAIRRKSDSPAPAHQADSAAAALSGGGPLPAAARVQFESRFERDFSGVRIHTHGRAAAAAKAINARAYTLGNDIAFASGAFAPGTREGDRLIAHELTHVVQQGAAPDRDVIRRAPNDEFEPAAFKARPTDFAFGDGSLTSGEPDLLYFNRPSATCPQCHGDYKIQPPRHERATAPMLVKWARSKTQEIATRESNAIPATNDLMTRNDAHFRKLVDFAYQEMIDIVLHDERVFTGSKEAREESLINIAVERKTITADVYSSFTEWAETRLVQRVRAALQSGRVPPDATLVSEPKTISQLRCGPAIEDGSVYFLGAEWNGKRVCREDPRSSMEFFFEVIGHEGVYFSWHTPPDIDKIASDVAKNTAAAGWAFDFIKGFLGAIFIAPLELAADTTAKVIDMATQGVAIVIGSDHYTCWSSTCKRYRECTENGGSPGNCKEELVTSALKEATIVIPLYEQGRACVADHDAEACGAIATVALGLVEEGAARVTKVTKFSEESAIRSAYGRRHAGEADFGAEISKRAEEGRKTKGAEAERTRMKAKAHNASIAKAAEFAKTNGIKPEQLVSETRVLLEDAHDPAKVLEPSGDSYDVRMKTNVNGEPHTYEREGDTGTWCRFTTPKCGVPVDPELDAVVDALDRPQPKRAKKTKSSSAKQYRQAQKDAREAFNFGDEPGQISAEVGTHKDARARRDAERISGNANQSAHSFPSSYKKSVKDYSRDQALTMMLKRKSHKAFDQPWKDWSQDQRRLGRKKVSVKEFEEVMSEAILDAPISDGQKSALQIMLHDELFSKYGLKEESLLELPYSSTKPLKGVDLKELTSRLAKEEAADEAELAAAQARTAEAQAKSRRETLPGQIAALEKSERALARSSNPKERGRASVYRLEIAKLKSQLADARRK